MTVAICQRVLFPYLNTGKQYVTAIPVVSSSVQNQHEAIQPGASYQQNVVGTYVQVIISAFLYGSRTIEPLFIYDLFEF